MGSDLREIAAACSQLAADVEGHIGEEAVSRYYHGRAEASGFTVSDRAVKGRLAPALEQLRWALATGVPPVLITSALAQGIRLLGRVGAAPRGENSAALAAEVGAPPGRSTASASSCGAGPRTASPRPCRRSPRRTRRSRGRPPAPASPWSAPSAASSPAAAKPRGPAPAAPLPRPRSRGPAPAAPLPRPRSRAGPAPTNPVGRAATTHGPPGLASGGQERPGTARSRTGTRARRLPGLGC